MTLLSSSKKIFLCLSDMDALCIAFKQCCCLLSLSSDYVIIASYVNHGDLFSEAASAL